MKKLNDLEFLKLSKINRFFYKFAYFFVSLPFKVWSFIKKIGKYIKKGFLRVVAEFVDIGKTFKNGDWKTNACLVN